MPRSVFQSRFLFTPRLIRPYLPAHPVLLPASSWAQRCRAADEALPVPCIPAQVPEVAADCSGFAAAQRAKKLGLENGYAYTPEQYVAWLKALGHASPGQPLRLML